jgi:hypothetical protein
MADKPRPSPIRSEDLRETFKDITDLLMQIRRQQLELEAYGTVSRLALGALLRAQPEGARAVVSRLRDAPEALLGPDIPPDSPLGRAVLAEAGRMAETLEGSAAP